MSKTSLPLNFPGLDYMMRVGAAWSEALVGQVNAAQEAWNDLRDGDYDLKRLGKLWATSAEGFYNAWLEAMRGPNFQERPAFLYVAYSKKAADAPNVLQRSVPLDRAQPPGTEAKGSPFVCISGGKAIDDAYQSVHFGPGMKSLEVWLKKAALDGAAPGQYLSFIGAQHRGMEPPLAIVTLSIE